MSVCLKYPSPPENEGMYLRFENFFFLKTPKMDRWIDGWMDGWMGRWIDG